MPDAPQNDSSILRLVQLLKAVLTGICHELRRRPLDVIGEDRGGDRVVAQRDP